MDSTSNRRDRKGSERTLTTIKMSMYTVQLQLLQLGMQIILPTYSTIRMVVAI